LFETPNGYSAYLAESGHYDEEDSDWASDETFTPKERYFPPPSREFNERSSQSEGKASS
jgi:hypothetical protein